MMRKLLLGLVLLPLFGSAVSAADRLDDGQLDRVTAGAAAVINCPTCIVAMSNSSSTNGITVTTSHVAPPPTGGGAGAGGGQGGDPGGAGPFGAGSPDGGPQILSPTVTANLVQLAGFNPLSP